ncbi:solute carrier family 22 member 3-like [Trichoplusia ni]|uniref:Solute carrier family 22 member 3-like n=1 Tax=Trichoplusia ni TaxID=7111 RepID=A0A7E5WZ06_TRINI|nr:solute carrier family 22 member 3-like [Trichoplusia ni]
MTSEEKVARTHLDDVLKQFGMFGRYHSKLILLIGLAYASNAAFCANYIFAAEHVEYRCKDETFAINKCGSINGTRCTEWVYEKEDSFMAEFDLACQDWKRTLVGTIRSVAYMFGLLFVGPLSDRIGRKKAIVLTGMTGGVLGIAKSFAPNYAWYMVLEFLESAFGDSCSPVYILNVEIVTTKKRVPFYVICGIGYAIGGVIQALIAWQVQDWRNFLRVLYAPALLFFLYLYLLDESPRWLLTKGRKNEAAAIIRKMAKTNKIKVDEKTLDGLVRDTDGDNDLGFKSVLKSTFTSITLFRRFIVCVIWWITSTFVNYGLTIASVTLQGNRYLNFAIVSVVDLPGYFMVMYILMNYRRKIPLIITFLIGGVFCVGQPFLPLHLAWLSITMFMIGKLMASMFFMMTYMYTSELFPTYTRNSMHALCSSLGRIGSIAAPQMPLLAAYWNGLPALIFGITSLIAGLATFMVPDTANDALPDTVKEAEALGQEKPKAITNAPEDKSGVRNRSFEWTE